MPPSPFTLSSRTALITGGSKGLGLVMATAFAQAGADIVISSRTEADLKAAAEEIRGHLQGDARVSYVVADMSCRDDAKRLGSEAMELTGRIDILVNNAGVNRPQLAEDITDEVWDSTMQLNLSSAMTLTQAVVAGMKERGWGRIIHISTIMALASKEGRGSYSASKAALIGMARAHALELGPHNITVNCIAPGPFFTEMADIVLTKPQQDLFAERTALQRWGRPEEIAGPALLLASDAGSFITGTTIVVDGGTLCRTF